MLQADLVPAVHLALVEHAVLREEFDRLGRDQLWQCVDGRLQVRQTTRLRFDRPCIGIAVAVEHHGAVFGDDVGEQLLDGGVELDTFLDRFLENGRAVVQRVGHDGVQDDHGFADRLHRARRPELEAIPGEGEGAGAVPIARIGRQHREGVHADDHGALAL